jgi:hypothetical protein
MIIKLSDGGLTQQCPRLRTLHRGKRPSDELKGKVSGEQGNICVLLRQSLLRTKF